MSDRVSQYRNELKQLATCQPSIARILFKYGPKSFILAINDAVWTTLTGVIPISTEGKARVKRHQAVLRRIARPKIPVAQRRTVLATKAGTEAIRTLFKVLQAHI